MSLPISVYRSMPRRFTLEKRYSRYCLGFDGVNDRVLISPIVGISTPLTIEVWFRTQQAIWGRLIQFNDGTYLSAQVTGVVFSPQGGLWQPYVVTVPYRWNYLCLSYDGANYYAWLNLVYLGARVDATGLGAIPLATIGSTPGLTLFYTGYIDEFRITPLMLTAQQRLGSFYRGYARRELDARLVMRMEEGTDLVASDESGYGNNGALLPVADPPAWTDVSLHELLVEARV